MAWTKRQLVEDVFGELALAGWAFDRSPEEDQAAVRKVDTMLGTWLAQGINLGYVFGTSPTDTDLDTDSGLPVYAIEAVVLNGAIRVAAGKGKALAASTKASAKQAYDAVLIVQAHAQVQEQQRPSTMPIGAGVKPWRSTGQQPFVTPPNTDPLTLGADGGLVFSGT